MATANTHLVIHPWFMDFSGSAGAGEGAGRRAPELDSYGLRASERFGRPDPAAQRRFPTGGRVLIPGLCVALLLSSATTGLRSPSILSLLLGAAKIRPVRAIRSLIKGLQEATGSTKSILSAAMLREFCIARLDQRRWLAR